MVFYYLSIILWSSFEFSFFVQSSKVINYYVLLKLAFILWIILFYAITAALKIVLSWRVLDVCCRFHPSCMGMTIEEAKKLDHFLCSDCSSDDDPKRSLNAFSVSPSVEAKVRMLMFPFPNMTWVWTEGISFFVMLCHHYLGWKPVANLDMQCGSLYFILFLFLLVLFINIKTNAQFLHLSLF